MNKSFLDILCTIATQILVKYLHLKHKFITFFVKSTWKLQISIIFPYEIFFWRFYNETIQYVL